MGSVIQARCPCGFESGQIFAGGGFKNFEQVDAAPALCMTCMQLVVMNYYDNDSKCPSCGERVTFYKDPKLQAPDQKMQDLRQSRFPVDRLRAEMLAREVYGNPDVQYLCPKCGKFTMKFFCVGDWD